MKPLFLLTNDDGVNAEGIHELAKRVSEVGDVYMVAPHVDKSGTSHCITFSGPVRVEKLMSQPYCSNIFSVTGNPADCVMIALDKILPRKPDFVLSGINRGSNLGFDTLYSGTVGAAMEAAMHHVPSMAISAFGFGVAIGNKYHFESAAEVVLKILRIYKDLNVPNNAVLNINVPCLPIGSIKGIKGAIMGHQLNDKSFYKILDPQGKEHYWLGPTRSDFEDIEGSDCNLVDAGYATVSVLKPNFLAMEEHSRISKSLETFFKD